jgi:hypothetical protein
VVKLSIVRLCAGVFCAPCFLVSIGFYTTRKLAFSNQFRDRKISVALETELETKISCVKVKKNPVAKSVAM